MILLLTAIALGSAPDCAERKTAAELHTATARATLAFLGADLSGYEASREEAWAMLPCLDEIVPPEQVAALHQLAALDGFYQRQDGHQQAALLSLARDENYDLPSTFGESHPLQIAWVTARETVGPDAVALPVPDRDIVLLDGSVSLDWQAERTTLVQVLDGTGNVQQTRMAFPGDAPPEYEVGDETSREEYLAREIRTRRRPVPVAVASAVLLATGGALYGLSAADKTTFWDESTSSADLERLRLRNNGMVVGAGASAGIGLALGITAVVTW